MSNYHPDREQGQAETGVLESQSTRQSSSVDSELFRFMVESVKDYAIFATDVEGRVLSWNTGAQHIFGYAEAEIIGQNAAIIFTPEDIESHAPEEEMRTAESEGRAEDERWHVRKDGSRFWASGIVTPLRDEAGNIRGFVKVARDNTKGRLAAEALRQREEELADFFDNAVVGLHWVGPDGTILRVNQAELDLLGYTREEYLGHNITEFHADRDVISDILQRLKRNETLNNYEARLRCKDGSIRHVLISSNVRRQNGEFIHTRCFTRDITARKRVEDSLRQQTETLVERTRLAELNADMGLALTRSDNLNDMLRRCAEAIVKHLDAAFARIWTLNKNEEMLELQASAGLYTHLDGLHERVPVGKYKIGLIAKERRPHLTNNVMGDSRISDLEWARREGMVAFAGYPLIVEDQLLGVMAMFARKPLTEATFQAMAAAANALALGIERKRGEEERAQLLASEQRARQEAEAANRTKDEFLGTLSHELRTPLTAILGWARMLSGGQLDEANRQRALETIERSARAQSQLIEDILDVSRVISGKMRLEVRPLDLTEVIEAAVDTALPAAEAKDIRLQRVLDSGASMVSGDSTRLQQVVWNLLSNAIKFTPRGGRVQVRLERVNSQVEIVVSDTGQGITSDILPFIFERFRQADSTSTRAHGGLGLGLAIVRHLVELHGGTVEAESAGTGQGSTFTVRLPLIAMRSLDVSSERRKDRVHPTISSGVAFECPPVLNDLHVLVVDDEEDTRIFVKTVLEQCGARVSLASSVAEALAVLKESRPDVMISDLGMPEADGYALIKKVRALSAKEGGRTPAAALTAYARVEDRMKVLRSGFQIHLPKPIEPAELVTVVTNLAGRITES